jgi:hypothetical protein
MNNDPAARRNLIAGLRAVADFYERNPAAYYDGMRLTINMYAWGPGARTALQQTAHALGVYTQSIDQRNVTIAHDFSDQVTLALFAPRQSVSFAQAANFDEGRPRASHNS